MKSSASKFFIPHTTRSNYETVYDTMKSVIKYQMSWSVSDRRIESLRYVSNHQQMTAKVGELGQIEHYHQVVAIFEAALYIIVTRTEGGGSGPMILVDANAVTEINDFAPKAEPLKVALPPVV